MSFATTPQNFNYQNNQNHQPSLAIYPNGQSSLISALPMTRTRDRSSVPGSSFAQGSLSSARNLGNLSGKAEVMIDDTVNPNAKNVFRLNITKRSRLRFSLSQMSEDVDLKLLNANGQEIGRSTNTGLQGESLRQRLRQGTYFVQVDSNSTTKAEFTLRIQNTGSSVDAGNTRGAALHVGRLDNAMRVQSDKVSRSDRDDFYRFEMTQAGNVRLGLRNLKRDAELYLLDSKGVEVAQSNQSGNSDEVIETRLNAGTYFVRVSPFNARKVKYTLEMAGGVTLGESGNDTDGDFGGNVGGSLSSAERQTAAAFTRNGQADGGNRARYYGFSLTEGGIFDATLTGNTDMRLIRDSNNNGAIDAGEVVSQPQRIGNESLRRYLGSGNYFLEVTSETNQATSFTVKTSFTALGKGDRRYLNLTRTNQVSADGLVAVRMELMQDGKAIDALNVISGQPGKQFFRTGNQSQSGSGEPLPEGYWTLGEVEWASGRKGDESKNWPADLDGLGPIWVTMSPQFWTERSAIGIHLDSNSSMYPGTVGCPGFVTKADMRRFVSWFDDAGTAPKVAVVDWNLGTVET